MRTRSSRSARTDGSTARTRATRSLTGTRLVAPRRARTCAESRRGAACRPPTRTLAEGGNALRLQHRHRGCSVALVRQREVDRDVLQVLGDVSGQPDPRSPPHVGDDLDVAVDPLWQHRPFGEPRPRPRLDHGLLGRPPCREVPRRRRTLVRGVAALTGGERLGEHGARLVDLFCELRNANQVDPYPDYAHGRKASSSRSWGVQALTSVLCSSRKRSSPCSALRASAHRRPLLFAQALISRTNRLRRAARPRRAASQLLDASPGTRGRSVGRPASRTTPDRPRWPPPACADPPAPWRWPGSGSPRAARDPAPPGTPAGVPAPPAPTRGRSPGW